MDFPETLPTPLNAEKFGFDFSLLKAEGNYSKKDFLLSNKNFSDLEKKLNYYTNHTLQQMQANQSLAKIASLKEKTRKLFTVDRNNISQDILDNGIWEVRLDKKARLFGYLGNNIFYPVLIDMKHRILP